MGICAVWGPPQSGKTTLAIDMAFALSMDGQSVCLISPELYSELSIRLNTRIMPSKSLAVVRSSKESIKQLVHTVDELLYVLAVPIENDAFGEEISEEKVKEILNQAIVVFDHVIVDCPSHAGSVMAAWALNMADDAAYLKIAPDSLQIEVRTLPADTSDYIQQMKEFLEHEENTQCREMIEDNIREIGLGIASEAVRHRFFMVFQYEPNMRARDNSVLSIVERLNEEADTAKRYLDICELEVLEPYYADNFVLKLLYEIINKKTSQRVTLPEGVFDMTTSVHGIYEV